MIDRAIVVGIFVISLAVLAAWFYIRPRMLIARLNRRELPTGLRLAGHPVVVAFTSPDCAACQTAQGPALQELIVRLGRRIDVQEVDVLATRDMARAFGIFTVPSTVVLDARGSVVGLNVGFASADRLLAQLRVAAQEW